MRSFAVAILFFIAGCHFGLPKVANVAVQQGNVITQEMIDRLKPGMTRRQVAFVMGEPVLRDPFNPDRWDYVYSVQVGRVVYQQMRMSLFFDGDLLMKFSGDLAPTTVAHAAEAKALADPLLPSAQDAPLIPPSG